MIYSFQALFLLIFKMSKLKSTDKFKFNDHKK